MLKLARNLISKGGWGIVVAYIVCCVAAYLVIWMAIEPTGIGDKVQLPPGLFESRLALHLISSIIVGGFILIFLLHSVLGLNIGVHVAPNGSTFGPVNSVLFYDQIAEKYDDRNSASLYAAHHKIIEEIVSAINDRKKTSSIKANLIGLYGQEKEAKILDLGGGTGKLIASYFTNISSIEWHYVDESPLMMRSFNENLDRHFDPLKPSMKRVTTLQNIEAYIENPHNVEKYKSYFDIVVISFALTSMQKNPDWAKLSEYISSGGYLIVADIDASYTIKFPYYSVKTDQGDIHLKPRSVPLSEILDELNGKFRFQSTFPIRQNTTNYAYVAVFRKP